MRIVYYIILVDQNKMSIKSFLVKKIIEWKESSWLLGICENGFDDLKSGTIHWIDNGIYEGRKWFADPFILDYNENVVRLLVEEFDYQVHRGRIARLVIDRNKWVVTDCSILLDIDTHLSFPMIWKEGETVYVCPENYHSGGWNIYRYDDTSSRLEYVKQVSYEKLTDATIFFDGTSYWLLSTYEPRPNGSELTIWKSKDLYGPYVESQKVKFIENVGRNAGMIFKYGEKMIRPAQESNHQYGHSISFQKVSVNDGKFVFTEIYRFNTPHKKYDAGTHTYNQHINGMAVLDAKGYRYNFMGRIINTLFSIAVMVGLKNLPVLK